MQRAFEIGDRFYMLWRRGGGGTMEGREHVYVGVWCVCVHSLLASNLMHGLALEVQ